MNREVSDYFKGIYYLKYWKQNERFENRTLENQMFHFPYY